MLKEAQRSERARRRAICREGGYQKNEPKLHHSEYRESLVSNGMKRKAHKSQQQNDELTK